ncbi:ASKHA domain-containing protein [Pseudodesulfovibrio sediminis]|uniref:(2Fe-2S)-binding protein n=1 Tax=Pseudodesulfovibrio sediminis TaxID=2810563 RepID=A0ABM7PAU0_9BACT|nr:ASKHA domain-containing protein [Pseudodesulfovibrio sediminis]BCS90201.1 (2Fe-2S)-binding protein [Pseudodesulfovibrio sediminis]
MSILIHTHDGGRFALETKSGDTLARTIFMSRLWHGVPLCSGLGKCGLCRVRFLSDAPEANADERKKLGQEKVDEGWRLACLHPSEPCEIELPEPMRSQRAIRTLAEKAGDFALAVDLGTTSIHWTALVDGTPVASGQELNPQTGLGSEIMSRLAVAATAEGRFVLRALITDRITELALLATRNLGGQCTSLVVSGNPAMTYILLGKKPDDLAAAPYTLTYEGGDERRIGAGLPPAYIPPLLAPFVGADLSAGLTAIEYGDTPDYPFLLADLGTNGEFVLALSPDKRICASVPMGPALEGVGLSFGRTAGPGAITGFTLTPKGLEATYFEGPRDGTPGMTGTGYLSLTAILLKHGILTDTGQFGEGNTPLAAKLAAKVTTEGDEPAFVISDDLCLPASDVEEILKVKAAFNLAMSTLLKEADLTPGKLAAIHIAGALGEHVSLNDLETIGFLPPGGKARTIKAGNTSLKGSEILTVDPESRVFAEGLADTLTRLELTGDTSFGDEFIKRMRFGYVD